MEKVICAKIISIVEPLIVRVGSEAYVLQEKIDWPPWAATQTRHKYNDAVHPCFSCLQVIGTDFGR